jgi:hypothetical protein
LNPTLLLHRQIPSAWIQGDRVTSQSFKPYPKDNNRVSVYRDDLMSAEEAWRHYTEELRLNSVGIVAVSVEECRNESLAVDPDGIPYPAHASIVFPLELSKNQIEKTAGRLAAKARSRGWQYGPVAIST